MARRGDECAPDLAAKLGADRDVLQVRIRAAQTSGRRDRLVEAGMHAAGLRVDHHRQRVDVRALQLVQRAPLEDEPRQFVRERQLLEHFGGRRKRARLAGFLRRRQIELLEQDSPELLRRVDVEFLAGQLVDPRGVAGELLFDLAATARRAPARRSGCRRARRRRAPA